MLPPPQEGDRVIRDQPGNSPNSSFPEFSPENIVNNIPSITIRRRMITELAIAYHGKYAFPHQQEPSEDFFQQNDFGLLQFTLKETLRERRIALTRRNMPKEFLSIQQEYINNLIDFYIISIFFSNKPPKQAEIDPSLLHIATNRIQELLESRNLNSLNFRYKVWEKMEEPEKRKLADLIFTSFRTDLKNTEYQKLAKSLLTVLNILSLYSLDRTTFVSDLVQAASLYKGKSALQTTVRDWIRTEGKKIHANKSDIIKL